LMAIKQFKECPGCGAKHSKPTILSEGKPNWSVGAFCDKCKSAYKSFLSERDYELEVLEQTERDIMEGWNEKRRNPMAMRIACKPRELLMRR